MEKLLTRLPISKWQSIRNPLMINGTRCQVRHIPLKRIFDALFSLLVLVLSLPLILTIALIIKFSSKGPIFYAHKRIGRGGKRFYCLKFRTMYTDAKIRLAELLAEDPLLREEWEKTHKLKKDPRITPIGALLRKASLDEWPQWWNVLKGDLSVVGPRPVEQLEIAKHFGPKAAKILSIRPGLTCLWQTSGRSNTTYAQRVQLDEKYVDTRNFLLDLSLIAKTVPVILFSKGAY